MNGGASLRNKYSWVVSAIIAFRILSAPCVAVLYLNGRTGWALALFLLAVFTDALDGFIARRIGGAILLLGAYADPTADFILVMAAFTAFVLNGVYQPSILALLAALFGQFLVTSRFDRPIYDPLGKYLGVFLFAAAAVDILLPFAAVYRAVLAIILCFAASSLTSRLVFLIGGWKKIKAGGVS